MATKRNPLFLGRWFEDEILVPCVRWWVSGIQNVLSRSGSMMAERGI